MMTTSENKIDTMTDIRFLGKASTLFVIKFKNILLTLITFGIYSFWGRNRVRRYVIQHWKVGDHVLQYHGTGKELFKGALMILPFIVLVVLAMIFSANISETLHTIVIWVSIFFLIPTAYFAKLKYLASRSSLKGIRFKIKGSALKYGAMGFLSSIAKILTAGLTAPYVDVKLMRLKFAEVYYGDTKVDFNIDEDALRALKRTHFKTLLLVPFTLGVSRYWYHAAKENLQYNSISIAGISLYADLAGKSLLKITLQNIAIVVCSFGVLAVWPQVRNYRYLADHVTIKGDLSTIQVAQAAANGSAIGDAVDGIFDGGVNLGAAGI